MSHTFLVLDASPIFNLLGCGSPELILAPLSGRVVAEEHTLREIRRNPFDNGPAAPTIERLVANNLLSFVRMGATAYESYIELVGADPVHSLGSGESAAIAYANDCQGIVVLDDRKARRVGLATYPNCEQYSSIDLFRISAQQGGMPQEQIAELIRLAMSNSRMHVLHKDRGWVRELGL